MEICEDYSSISSKFSLKELVKPEIYVSGAGGAPRIGALGSMDSCSNWAILEPVISRFSKSLANLAQATFQ